MLRCCCTTLNKLCFPAYTHIPYVFPWIETVVTIYFGAISLLLLYSSIQPLRTTMLLVVHMYCSGGSRGGDPLLLYLLVCRSWTVSPLSQLLGLPLYCSLYDRHVHVNARRGPCVHWPQSYWFACRGSFSQSSRSDHNPRGGYYSRGQLLFKELRYIYGNAWTHEVYKCTSIQRRTCSAH